jgi:hypothetical protein
MKLQQMNRIRPQRRPASVVTFERVRTSDPTLDLVKEDGVVLGFIEKWKDDATTISPYKAYPPRFVPGSRPQVGSPMTPFYGKDGKDQAIEFLKRFK